MPDRFELAFLKNALSQNLATDPQEQTALENLFYQRLITGNLRIDMTGTLTGGGIGAVGAVSLTDGTAAAPALPFTNEPTTGRYRIGTNDVGESVAGVLRMDWNTARLQLDGLSLLFSPDNLADIGASGVTRPRDLWLGRDAHVGGTLTVTGPMTVGGTVTITAPITFNAATFNGNVIVNATLNVTGLTTLGQVSAGAITATGITDTGTLGVTGTATFNTATFNAGVAMNSTLNVTGTTTLGVTNTGALTVTGNAAVNGTVQAQAVNVPGGAISANQLALTSPLPVPSGGTGVTVGNNGGILFFNSATTMGNSQPLLAGWTVIGGGPGTAPYTVANGAPIVYTLTDAANIVLDASLGTVFRVSVLASRTINAPLNPTNGQKIIITHYANTTNPTLTLAGGAGGFRFGSDIPALTPTATSHTDYIGCVYYADFNRWDVVAVTKGF